MIKCYHTFLSYLELVEFKKVFKHDEVFVEIGRIYRTQYQLQKC